MGNHDSYSDYWQHLVRHCRYYLCCFRRRLSSYLLALTRYFAANYHVGENNAKILLLESPLRLYYGRTSQMLLSARSRLYRSRLPRVARPCNRPDTGQRGGRARGVTYQVPDGSDGPIEKQSRMSCQSSIPGGYAGEPRRDSDGRIHQSQHSHSRGRVPRYQPDVDPCVRGRQQRQDGSHHSRCRHI